jgi:hypothetical protein
MARTEELILRLTQRIGQISFAVMNLQLPDVRSREQFWPLGLQITDLGPAAAEVRDREAEPLERLTWPVGEKAADVAATDLDLWRPLLDRIEFFDSAGFKIKTGHLVPGEPQHFEAKVAFSGLARMKSGGWSWIRSSQKLRWRLLSGANPERAESWRIVDWHTLEMTHTDAPERLFREVLDYSLDDPGERQRARENRHERLVARVILASRRGEEEPVDEYFAHPANDRHPGLAVVDIDADGFDDLYVMQRLGPNQMLRNRGDGSFEDVAPELGLDVADHCSSAVFADFDNDGDPDVFVGRTLAPSVYLENAGGRFVDRSDQMGWMPRLVSSVSAVDYDGDGLLDVYAATYAGTMLWNHDILPFVAPRSVERLKQLLPRSQSTEGFVNLHGPPNVMMRNQGSGRFRMVEDGGPVESFRNTYQATWADYDADGDPDVYLANDFADDQLLRNDGGGRFSDVTDPMGFDQFALGMGASWGDYDRDGRQDVYVSNMYSTAGSRIISQLDYLDPRYGESAQGNFLWRNEGGSFRRVSGDDGIVSEKTGWSWGGQLADIDNDGFLDIVVLNGFYTAPPEVALAGDT